MNKYLVGVDLGTSTTVLSCLEGNRPEPRPDPLNALNNYTPSAVLVREGKVLACGDAALHERAAYPEHVVVEVKRDIGTERKFPAAASEPKKLLAHEVLAELLYYRLRALPPQADAIGAKTIAVVISIPAYYGPTERRRTREAWELAAQKLQQDSMCANHTFELVDLIDEPLAAAICHSYEESEVFAERPFLVLDLGGGTFDITAYTVNMQRDLGCLSVSVLAKAGEQKLGGIDWDEVLATMWAKEAGTPLGNLNDEDRYELLAECEQTRHRLGQLPETKLRASANSRTVSCKVNLNDFERYSSDLLQRVNQCITDAIDRVKKKTGLDESAYRVLLVGGATHMPMIQKLVKDRFGNATVRQHRAPQQAVARGACLYCAVQHGVRFNNETLRNISKIEVRDILTRSYGIMGYDQKGKYGLLVIIPRNSLCDGKEYEHRDAAIGETLQKTLEMVFGGVENMVSSGEFLLVSHLLSLTKDLVELRIPDGITAEKGQPLRIFLKPQPNGEVQGRAELWEMDQPGITAKKICDVEFTLRKDEGSST